MVYYRINVYRNALVLINLPCAKKFLVTRLNPTNFYQTSQFHHMIFAVSAAFPEQVMNKVTHCVKILSEFGNFLVRIFPHARKYGPEKSKYGHISRSDYFVRIYLKKLLNDHYKHNLSMN